MNERQNADLSAAEYVLGLTDSQTRQRLQKRLNDDPAFAAEVQHWQKAFSGLDVTTGDVTPPSAIWQQIERDIEPNQPVAEVRSVRKHPMFWPGWGMAALMTGIVIFMNVNKTDTSHVLQPIAVLSGTQSNAQFVVSLDKSASTIQVAALNVMPPQNKDLQLWMIKGSAAPQSLGLINPRETNTFSLASVQLDKQTVLAISLEPPGGSTQTGPSGPVIFQGTVSAL